MFIVLLAFTFLCSANAAVFQRSQNSPLSTLIEWNVIDFNWTSEEQKEWYITNDFYIPEHVLPTDIDQSQDGRIFIVTPNLIDGVAATLSTVVNKTNFEQPEIVLQPYPDWSWHSKNESCTEKINNVHAIAIDSCQRLWVLDAVGRHERQTCKPQLLAFDLRTNERVYQTWLNDKNEKISKHQWLTNLVVESKGNFCENTTVYITDAGNNGIQTVKIISNKTDKFLYKWNHLKPNKNYSTVIIANQSFELDIGLVGVSLTPEKRKTEIQRLFLRPVASISLFSCNTTKLKSENETTVCNEYADVLQSQGTMQAFSSNGTLYYGLSKQPAIGCWNIQNKIVPRNFKIAVTDFDRLTWSASMKIVNINGVENLLVMGIRLDKFLKQSISPDEINFYVMAAPVSKFSETCDRITED